MRKLEGKVVAKQVKIGIVAARFNEFIVSKLVSGAQDALIRHGVNDDDIDIAWVPGAFEIPLIAQKMAETEKYDAVICLGAVIRGATSHYDYVCNEASKGIAQAQSLFPGFLGGCARQPLPLSGPAGTRPQNIPRAGRADFRFLFPAL